MFYLTIFFGVVHFGGPHRHASKGGNRFQLNECFSLAWIPLTGRHFFW